MADGKKFDTARMREVLAGNPNSAELGFVKAIEEYGYQALGIKGCTLAYNWSYTLGVFDTSGRPELLTVGLQHHTAAAAFDQAVKLLREGIDLTSGRHGDLIGNVDVIFRPVDQRWTRLLMNSARWFNGGWEFPVLQMIFPDLEGRFQWEAGFEERFRQPLLKSVHDGTEPVTYVSHDADGDWQFLGDTMSDGGGPVLSCLHHPIDADASLKELADLPLGWYAARAAVAMPWERYENLAEPEA